MYLVAGLGNPGDKYKNTRHNIGFLVIDEITKKLQITNINNQNFKAAVLKNSSTLYVKPQTFMNESGSSIINIVEYYNIPNEDIIVVHDDLDLPFGTVRYKIGGGAGGHNGLRSLDNHIGKDYIRVRVGIGKPASKSDVTNYVLNNFSKQELELLYSTIMPHIMDSIESLKTDDIVEVKSKYTMKLDYENIT